MSNMKLLYTFINLEYRNGLVFFVQQINPNYSF